MRFDAAAAAPLEADVLLASVSAAPSPLLPAQRLIERLRAEEPIRRVGLLQVAPGWLGRELQWAAQLAICGLTPFDYAAYLRASLAPSARYVGLTASGLLDHLGALTRGSMGGDVGGNAIQIAPEIAPFGLGAALLLWNFDLALCLLSGEGRAEFWRALAGDAFPRGARALLLALPSGAPVGPDDALIAAWESAGRAARLG